MTSLPSLSSGVTATDSHCHLDEVRFDGDRGAVIERALAAGIGCMITIGASDGVGRNYAAVELAARHPQVFATVGVHPHDASMVTPAVLDELAALAQRPKVVAIGETGLDYYYRRAACSRRCFANSSIWHGGATCLYRSICATPTTTRCRSCARRGPTRSAV
jgi:Tat protein secretion system quality control protein TatD with DNase activity